MEDTGFGRFLDDFDGPERTVCTVNRTEPAPVQRLLEQTFSGRVDVEEASLPDAREDLVVVLEDGAVVAASPLEAMMDAVLLTNTDAYRTSDVGLAPAEVPDVLTALDETVFEVRGYPASNKEKLLLTVLSRYVEGRALDAGAGTLRTLFQRLSRIEDERGTRAVYDRLTSTAVDVHLYGVPDWSPPDGFDATLHGGTSGAYRHSWCVVFTPDGPAGTGDDADPAAAGPAVTGPAALVAERRGEANRWRGGWTFDADSVAEIARYVETL